jgi:hypothetical protein
MLNHDSYVNHLKQNFELVQHHKHSITELESMLPFEREIWISLLNTFIEEENERLRKQRNG